MVRSGEGDDKLSCTLVCAIDLVRKPERWGKTLKIKHFLELYLDAHWVCLHNLTVTNTLDAVKRDYNLHISIIAIILYSGLNHIQSRPKYEYLNNNLHFCQVTTKFGFV